MKRKMHEPLTRNIAKSGEVHNWSGFSPFQLHLGLIMNCSQSASCHIATVVSSKPKKKRSQKKHKPKLVVALYPEIRFRKQI